MSPGIAFIIGNVDDVGRPNKISDILVWLGQKFGARAFLAEVNISFALVGSVIHSRHIIRHYDSTSELFA